MAQRKPARDSSSPEDFPGGNAGFPRVKTDLNAAIQDFHQILHESPVGISVSRVRDGMIVDMNEEFLRILGFTREEVIGRTSHELNLWTAEDQRDAIVREFREKGKYSPRPARMRRKDGSLVTVLFSASTLASGDEPHTIAWVMDITDRLRIGEQLRVSEERWRSLVENAPAVITIINRDGSVLSVNQTITRRPREEVLGANAFSFLPAQAQEQARELVESVFRSGAPAAIRLPVYGPDGDLRWFEHRLAPVFSGQAVTSVICLSTDINPQVLAETALRESEQRFGDIVRSLGDWVWEIDTAGRFTYCSPQIEGLLGYAAEQLLGKSPWDTAVPEDRAKYHAGHESLIRHPEPFRDRTLWHLHRDGRRVCLAVSGVPVFDPAGALRGFRGVAHDVTQRLREEAEVQQARRVESLGVLAGGIAHDFNNLLTAILGNAELALAELPEGTGCRQLVGQIQTAGQLAAELTRQMLAYAGRGRLATQPVDLTTTVREMTQLLGASIPKKAELVLDLTAGLPAVEADPAQLRQIVMNLVINAAEAIGNREGRIDVRTMASSPADHFQPDLMLGRIEAGRESVCISITDLGDGIAPDTLAKIFDPFFTTKFTGRGLGLAAVLGIVLHHHGTIAVSSPPGAGTTFRVCFPASSSPPAEAALPATAAPGGAAAPWRGSGTILLVDDEAPVRAMAARMLRALGFQALTAADGREAVATTARGPAPRAVLLDLTMPHMDGRETFHELRRLRPDLPVVLCSGYDVLESADRFTSMDFSGFLQKPYRLDDLARVLQRALGE